MSEPPGSDMLRGKINQRRYNCTGASQSHDKEVLSSSLLFSVKSPFSRGPIMWGSGAEDELFHIVLRV